MSHRMRVRWLAWSALAGVVSAGAFLAVAEVLAAVFARQGSPLLAVGSFVIDIVPRPLKEFAITTFGDADKPALLAGLGIAVLVAAAVCGILQWIRPPLGVVGVALAGALSLAAVATRAGSTPLAWIPTIAGAVVGCVLIAVLVRRLRAWYDATASDTPSDASLSRRRFLTMTTITAAAAVVAGIGARVATATFASVDAIRGALKLPSPGKTVTVPEGAEFDIDGLSSLFTSNADFYRVDTALTVPVIDPAEWRLVIDGMVDKRIEIGFDDLLKMGVDEYAVTLTCVSNEVGGSLLGSAKWLGVPIRDVLALAGPSSDADMVLSRSVDGYTASTPLSSLTDDTLDAILAVGMNGEPLPVEHGFPVRMVVPGLYGYVSATKWVTELKVTRFDKDEAYWTPRGYSAEAPIKLSSRIDTPRTGKEVAVGKVAVAGVAWAQTVGIAKVEVSIDDAEWQQATLSAPVNDDMWVQWMLEWDAPAGPHYIAVRATDKDGTLQTEERAPIAPDGSSGWQRMLVTVR